VDAFHPVVKSPPPKTTVSGVIAFAALGLLLTGMFVSRIVPSQLSIRAGLILGGLLGIFAVIKWERQSSYTTSPSIMGNRVLRHAVFRIPLNFLLCVGFTYVSITWASSWLVNKAVGEPEERIVVVTSWQSGSSRNCSQPDIGLPLFAASVRALCVKSGARRDMPDGTQLRLVGRSSILGMNVEEIYIIHAPSPQSTSSASMPTAPPTRLADQ
jgi:hypothetical protein